MVVMEAARAAGVRLVLLEICSVWGGQLMR